MRAPGFMLILQAIFYPSDVDISISVMGGAKAVSNHQRWSSKSLSSIIIYISEIRFTGKLYS